MKKFTFIRETSNISLRQLRCCSRQLFYAILFIVTTVLNGLTLTAQNMQGTVPVQDPNGGFGIDGDAYANYPTAGIGDWFYNPAYPGSGGSLFNSDGTIKDPLMTFFLKDDWGMKDGTIFIGSNKINDNPNDPLTPYEWGLGNVPAKNEIQNVGAHFSYGDVGLGGNADDLWCIFAADRQVTNGAAYIDFEFLQKSLIMEGVTSGKFVSEGTDGGRTVGDILVTVIFTNGGTFAEVEIRVWEAVNGGYEYILHPNSEYSGSIYVTNNTSITNVPFDVYGVTPGVYVPNQWVEGAINLTELLNFGANPCAQVSTLFVRTKTSQAVNAELSDFPIGPVQLDLGVPELAVSCPNNVTMPACSTQEQINTAFAAWKTGFSYEGGVPNITEGYTITGGATVNMGTLLPPDICGGTVSITYTATDLCEQTDSCTATFTTTAPAPLLISDVQNMSVDACDYANQAAVDAAFAAWLSGFTVSGGCNPQGSYGTPVAPLLCTGGYVDVTYSVTDLCGSGSDTARFTLTAPDPLVISDVQNMSVESCDYANQAAVNAAFALWLEGFTVSGGCNPQGSYGTPVAPLLCTGGFVEVTFNVTDLCGTGSDTARFTLTAPPALVISDVQNMSIESCDDVNQAAVDAAFALWLEGFTVSGGCDPQGSYGTPVAPDICGGYVEVTFNVTDLCGSGSDTARFSITAPDPLVISDVQNMSVEACDYANQAAVDAAFALWLEGFTVTGGCDPQGSYGTTPVAPLLCTGGYVEVTFNVTDLCGNGSDTARFTITAPDPLVISDVQNMSVESCDYANQAAVDAAFALWLEGFTVSGGCDPQGSYGTPVAPLLCTGGYVDVTYNVTDLCANGSDTARFTLTAPPALVVSNVLDRSVESCDYANQAAVNAAFALWLEGFTVSGGCDPQGSYGTPVAPLLCTGGYVEVTFNVTDICGRGSDTARFTLTAPDPLVISDVQDLIIQGCTYTTQGGLDTAFALWLEGFTVSGGCDPQGVFAETYSAPDVMAGGFVDIVYNVTDLCESGTDRARFTVEPCILDQFCSYTQGYYGNPNGTSCDGENTFSTYGLIEKALDNYPGDVMRIGAIGHSILIAKSAADINNVIKFLPGGKGSYELSAGNISISDILFKNWYTTTVGKNNTKINNTLLAQTITLGLNLGMDNDLGNFALQEGTFATADLDGGCGSTIAKERYCDTDTGMVYNEYEYYTIMGNIAAAASNVYELFGLANAALGNADGIVGYEQGISLSNIAKAVDMINNAFDECRMFMGYGVEPLECEMVLSGIIVPEANAIVVEKEPIVIDSSVDFKVYPVPFEDVINVQYRFEYDTDVTIQVFNLQGGLIYGVVNNLYNNGEMAVKQINLARTFDQALVIRLTTNKEKLSKTIVAKSNTKK